MVGASFYARLRPHSAGATLVLSQELTVMRILAVDVGTGTQDILLFDSSQLLENNPKLVMPSATARVAPGRPRRLAFSAITSNCRRSSERIKAASTCAVISFCASKIAAPSAARNFAFAVW